MEEKPMSWVKTAGISATAVAFVITLSNEKLDAVSTMYENLVSYGIHGWAILGLIAFALYNQYMAIGVDDKIKGLVQAKENYKKAEQSLLETKNSLEKTYPHIDCNYTSKEPAFFSSHARGIKLFEYFQQNPNEAKVYYEKNINKIWK
ncbi:MAG: hypothetical protein N0C84_01435 [Candidatus Thiodiazotropha taylori]|uniref:Uncharacterized protein n=1 Tax=Candidatus Thiodiazotropha taylori TaxID=2792791 RepID=A0A9E4KAD0_9GAMM|nr:hypothetical protein [Candidatus Thiodiazotropha taylori]MCW4255110.1 hypothetical protein [Candidatus Thiodiazotropha taylori]